MADTIKIKRGLKEDMPKLNDYELGYCTDEKALYIGTTGGNVRLCGVDELIKITDIYAKLVALTDRMNELHPSD